PEDVVCRLEELAANEPVDDELRAEPRNLEAFQEALREDRGIRPVHAGPAYRFPDKFSMPINATWITRANLQLVRGMSPD
ncbi:MAG: hypothetical protein ACR2GA_06605, partial [Chloroflexota bacterium]